VPLSSGLTYENEGNISIRNNDNYLSHYTLITEEIITQIKLGIGKEREQEKEIRI
jgi:hypothetical protein